MKKSKVDKILVDQAKRKRHICLYSVAIIVFIAMFIFSISSYLGQKKNYYIKYDETSDIDYKVFLKENKFFPEKYLGKDRSYIASLIDYIDADFIYKIHLQEPYIEFKYAYHIEAEVNVKEKNNNNPLYNFKEEILRQNEVSSNGKVNLEIRENVKIDYNKYNELIKSFVKTYKLDDTVSTLTLRMYINVLGTCEDFDENRNNESIISIEIPLTTKTMNVEIINDLIKTEDNIMACKKMDDNSLVYLISGIITFIIVGVLMTLLVRYIVTTRTAEDIYHKELKKILNNYHSYIQKINNEFDIAKYQKLRVDTFTDMLEIRDTVQQPILMVENKQKDGVYFIIPTNTKILYIYGLKLSDIKKQIRDEK